MSAQEIATILAALRWYQHTGMADNPDRRPNWLHDIACSDDFSSMSAAEIDTLCERVNREVL